ncbi:MAG: hypothetical protein ACFB15_14285 [Cyclobacteriaceae bacterium]
MSDLSKQHAKWIKGFTKDNFDILVKAYIKSVWKINSVVIVDGSGDGGLDMKLFEDRRSRKIPIQVTVESKPYSKLKKDLVKINRLVNEFDYPPELYFFCSESISETKINELQRFAIEEFAIRLEIIDSKVIGSKAESSDHIEIRETIRVLLGDFLQPSYSSRFDVLDQLKYDLLAFSRESSQIKERIVEAFVLNRLYAEDNIPIESLLNCVNEDLDIDRSSNYCQRLIDKMVSAKRIRVDKGKCSLVESERSQISELKNNLDFQEEYFLLAIDELLEKHELPISRDDVLQQVSSLFEKSYNKDFNEIEENHQDEAFLSGIFQELRSYISISCDITVDEALDSIYYDLVKIIQENSVIQRVAAGRLFTKLFQSQEFQAYVNRTPKPIFLDTSICLYLICVYYNSKSSYGNPFFQIVKDLHNYYERGEFQIELNIYESYLEEIAYQFGNAISLALFEQYGLVSKLGGSNNPFYQFYKYINENDELNEGDNDYISFLDSFGLISKDHFNASDSRAIIISGLENLFETNGIRIIDPKINYSSRWKFKDFYSQVKRELENIHMNNRSERPSITVARDARMVCLLFDDQMQEIEPTFITWDKSFRGIRKYILNKYKGKTYWHLFRPSKFLDHLSLLNLQLNPNLLSNELLTMLDKNGELGSTVRTLADTMSKIIDLKSKNGISFTNGIAKIKADSVYNVNDSNVESHFHTTKYEPVDVIVSEIIKFFSSGNSKFNINSLRHLVNESDKTSDFLGIIENAVIHYNYNKKVPSDLPTKMVGLLEEEKSN